MHISREQLLKAAKKKGLNLQKTLEKAHVSKTAFYSLLRKENILPRSIQSIAKVLEVNPSAFLREKISTQKITFNRIEKLEKILKENPNANRENVWHTLILLEEKPISRLNKGLLRGQQFNFHR